MTYVALGYIGGKYSPGEIIREELPLEQSEWLLRAGAIRPLEEETRKSDPEPTPECGGVIFEEIPKEETDEAEREEPREEPCEETDEEIPEIDVMDGIVPAPAKAETKTGNGKKGGRKK